MKSIKQGWKYFIGMFKLPYGALFCATMFFQGFFSSVQLASKCVVDFVVPPVSAQQAVNLAPNETAKVNAIIDATLQVIEAEGWTAADVADAVKSLRGLYLRDTSTKSGRERWHGKVVGMPVTDAARGVVITRHEDGTVFEDPVNPPRKPAVTVTTSGIPAKLAEARKRRASEITNAPVEVVTRITAGH